VAEKLRRRVRARFFAALSATAGRLPPDWLYLPLVALSPLARFTRYERMTHANLDQALGADTTPLERRRIARGVRRHAARLCAEWIALSGSGGRGEWIDRAVELDPSYAILERELARGRGALIVTAHIGNWELLCTRLARLGLKGAVVGFERTADPSGRWLSDARGAHGVVTLSQNAPARAVLRVLARGEVVGLLADLEARRISGEFLPFMGRSALTMTAPASLARAAGVPLIPVACVREGGRYRLKVDDPLHLDPTLARREATLDLSARLNRVFERWIRTWPDQWAWHQPRWRTQPSLQRHDEDLARR
jgi:KDO2-lipid IV(A) lauroyltransferase